MLATVTDDTPVCEQPELRPDLTVAHLAVTQNQAQTQNDFFRAVIGNAGASAGGSFTVQLTYTHGTRATRRSQKTVASIGPHSSRTITFSGPVLQLRHPGDSRR